MAPEELAMLDVDGAVATLTLNRTEQRNALSTDLLDALHARMDEVERLGGVRVLVITGAGPAFCAGMDLKQVVIAESGDPGLPLRLLSSLGELTLRVRALPMVTVANVNGAAIGGGCGLVCVADVAITHDEAKLGFPEVSLGLCPAVVAPWVVARIGAGRARSLLLSGGVVSGAHAAALSLVSECVRTREDLEAATVESAERLSQGGPEAARATKALLNRLEIGIDEGLLMEASALSAQVLARPETQDALRARLDGNR